MFGEAAAIFQCDQHDPQARFFDHGLGGMISTLVGVAGADRSQLTADLHLDQWPRQPVGGPHAGVDHRYFDSSVLAVGFPLKISALAVPSTIS